MTTPIDKELDVDDRERRQNMRDAEFHAQGFLAGTKFERERMAGVLKIAEDTLEYCLRANPIEFFYINEALEKLRGLNKP